DVIARRAGVSGMIAGQSIDLLSEHMEPEAQRLCYIHAHKTADLLTAPLLAAGCIAGADETQMEALSRFGACVGLAFQIDDDLLDVEGDAHEMGKQTGMDAQRGKMTWPALFGVAQSRARSQELWSQAEDALGIFGERAWFLRAFAETLRNRKK
ncbi:MAG: polyprenyl synthetase family protein, partial [Candidatus Spyradocola sp.]